MEPSVKRSSTNLGDLVEGGFPWVTFSGYPIHHGYWPFVGSKMPPEVCPSRSSRTKDAPLKSQTPTADRDRTVSHVLNPARVRFVANSHTLGTCSSPGCDDRHRCNLPSMWTLGRSAIYRHPLSVERWPFHAEPPDHMANGFCSLVSVSQSGLAITLNS